MRFFYFLVVVFFLSGCESMGHRSLEIKAGFNEKKVLERCEVLLGSGTDIGTGFNADFAFMLTKESCIVIVNGSGGAVTASEGHKQEVQSRKELGKGITEGLVKGLKKSVMPVAP